ncbi:MAG: ATPase [Novosphingobium sp.]
MSRGTIAAVDMDQPDSGTEAVSDELVLDTVAAEEDWWEEPAVKPRRRWGFILGVSLAVVAVAGWTALFVVANLDGLRAGGTALQWTVWLRDWAIPPALIAMCWLLAMRNSRAEAIRFGETARMLSEESSRLEERLTTVNRELSLAREFIASQSRDIDSLGRVATERLSQHAEKLASLIQDNGTRIDAIGDVSTAALENMEKLRGQLPVIASSAKDVTNNIGQAGRAAHGQLDVLISGFKKLNEFGQASERQVMSLRDMVNDSLAEFTRQTEQLGTIAEQRFAALAESGKQARTQLDSQEVEALAAIRSRAAALSDELAEARAALDAQEAESLTSLRARLSSVRDEGSALTRSLRDGEATALGAWREAIVRLEEDLKAAIAKVGEIDSRAMESARARLAELSNEAAQVDERLAERDRLFARELEQRQAEFDSRHAAFVDKLSEQMGLLDAAAGTHRDAQDAHLADIAAKHKQIGEQLATFSSQLGEFAEQSTAVESRLGIAAAAVSTHLEASNSAIAAAEGAVAVLTDNSVRLLELIQASVQHTTENLPEAIGISEGRLSKIEERVRAVHSLSGEAASRGESLLAQAAQSREVLAAATEQMGVLQAQVTQGQAQHGETLAQLQQSLDTIRAQSLEIAEQAQDRLTSSIEELNTSARDAVMGIETMSAASISALAGLIGEESGAAIDAALRDRAAQLAGQLEEASAKAAGASREAAMQLRDQLAKVNELAGNLERRVAHARSRAEEQVDNDFARRVALITESLNSNAIDLARALDTDVTDTSWAAYLKGDRGIFTRRAVRLLDTAEAKAVAQLYEADRDFREHVSRYIHDFEAMLRQLLSTRDGHALGVTLLSSDMGKLYVALAQAIERLRN